MMNANGIANMINHFLEPNVGAVSSIDGIDENNHWLEKILVKYENFLRIHGSVVSSCIGVSGSFFVTKKNIFKSIPKNCTSDFAIALECRKQGLAVKVEQHSLGFYKKTRNLHIEFFRKTRTIAHGMNTLVQYKELLNVFQYGLLSLQLYSHKILRWALPLLLLILFILFGIQIIAQLGVEYIFITGVVVAFFMLVKTSFLYNGALLFVYVAAISFAIYSLVVGNRWEIWEPTKR